MKYLDALALAKLRRLSLHIKRPKVEGLLSGARMSALKGSSQEFAEYRAYAPGDDPRQLDWKVLARTDRYYIRERQAESMMAFYALLDGSGSMGYSSQGRERKWDYACRLGLAFAYLAMAAKDAAGIGVFGSRPTAFHPPRQDLEHLSRLDDLLARFEPEGIFPTGSFPSEAASRVAERSHVLFISDFIGDPEAFFKAVRALKLRRGVWAIQILDPAERDFDFSGPLLLESLEDRSTLSVEPAMLREEYRSALARLVRYYQAAFSDSQIRFGVYFTDEPWDRALSRFLGLA